MGDRLANALWNDSNGAVGRPYVAVTTTKPSGTVSTLTQAVKGLHPVLVDSYTRAGGSVESLLSYVSFWCAQCEERLLYDRDGYRKNRGKPAFVHIKTSSPWCPRTKQHGPKTRRALPVPSLYVINESGLLDV